MEAAKQVFEKDYSVAEVVGRLGTTIHSIYAWVKKYAPKSPQANALED
ncbi:transposase [Acinetobacter haemolyticus]|nr:transposase [Acinetobacter haemolyticus]